MKGVKMKFFENGNTQLFALGGMGEVGKNMYVIMHTLQYLYKECIQNIYNL